MSVFHVWKALRCRKTSGCHGCGLLRRFGALVVVRSRHCVLAFFATHPPTKENQLRTFSRLYALSACAQFCKKICHSRASSSSACLSRSAASARSASSSSRQCRLDRCHHCTLSNESMDSGAESDTSQMVSEYTEIGLRPSELEKSRGEFGGPAVVDGDPVGSVNCRSWPSMGLAPSASPA